MNPKSKFSLFFQLQLIFATYTVLTLTKPNLINQEIMFAVFWNKIGINSLDSLLWNETVNANA